MDFGLVTRFIACFQSERDYTLQFTVTHALMSTVMSSLPLLGSDFQLWIFPFLWVPEQSPTSAISF
jgi:hypothetical protein